MGKLNLAVDCWGNVLTWKWNSASILSSHLLCGKNLITMSSTGPNWSHDGKKNFCNKSTASNIHGQECICLQGEEADIKMIVHVADAVENVH